MKKLDESKLAKLRNINEKIDKEIGEVGKERSYIARIEKGETDMQLSSLVRIARALGIEFTPSLVSPVV